MYNVFTFLDNDGDSDHEEEGEPDYFVNMPNQTETPPNDVIATARNEQPDSEIDVQDPKNQGDQISKENFDDKLQDEKKTADQPGLFSNSWGKKLFDDIFIYSVQYILYTGIYMIGIRC